MKSKAAQAAADIEVIATSDLFDAEWYVSQYPDVAQLDLDPAAHYLFLGSALGRRPCPNFDPDGYLENYPDIEGQNPLLHYLTEGRDKGYLPMPNGMSAVGLYENDLAPPSPPAEGDPCYLPDAMAQRAKSAKSQPWLEGSSAVYRDVRAHFDTLHYVTSHFDMARMDESFDLVRHYVRAGDKEGRTPNPNFSSKAYRRRYGKTLKDGTNFYHHWITEGRRKGMIGHAMPRFEEVAKVLGMNPADAQEKLISRTNDLRKRLESGELGKMVQKATNIEPLVSRTWRQALQPNIQPFHRVDSADRLVAIHALQEAAGFSRAKAVVCVGGPRWGSNRRLEGHVTHALAAEYGAENIIFMSLDKEGELPIHKYPEGVRCIDGASLTSVLKAPEKERVVLEFLRSLRADAVFNVNCSMLWQIQGAFGPIVKNDVPVVGCFFCNDKSIYGTWGGYPASQFYRQFPNMKAVCTDSHFLRDSLIDQYYVPDDQKGHLHVLEAPVSPDLPCTSVEPPENERPQLFWAGRLDLQKRLDVAYEVARRLPNVDIRMWGQKIANGPDPEEGRPENVVLEGSYSEFAELPLNEADLWFYTSEWDGVPSILLEVAMTGLPLVGSSVGGTGEVLHEDLSWPVAPCDNVDAYVEAIEEVLSNPRAARTKAQALRERLIKRRTEAFYQEQVRAVVEGPQS